MGLRSTLRIRIILIYNRGPPSLRIAETMYVCLCNGVTDQQLLEAAAEPALPSGTGRGASFAERIVDRLGVGFGCGSCRSFAVDLVERAASRQASARLPERGRASSGLDLLPGRCGDPAYRLPADRKEDTLALRGA